MVPYFQIEYIANEELFKFSSFYFEFLNFDFDFHKTWYFQVFWLTVFEFELRITKFRMVDSIWRTNFFKSPINGQISMNTRYHFFSNRNS